MESDEIQADGCLAGSHLAEQPNISADAAVPVEAPRGSHIVFHGATVHGAYPKQTPGLRLTPVIYFRRIDW
ncbi:MAG: phytanoyl-CoA dioxygenase family protein [Proteobacteria bacterium]|nr:phytanoyl-CoA dioxygenase family protein [Pseudomonadota bacterium]